MKKLYIIEVAGPLPPGITSFPVALSWVVSVGRAELFAAWFRALLPGSGPVLRFHAYASVSVLLPALFFFPAFPILFPSLTGLSKSESLVSRFWLMRQPAFEEA